VAQLSGSAAFPCVLENGWFWPFVAYDKEMRRPCVCSELDGTNQLGGPSVHRSRNSYPVSVSMIRARRFLRCDEDGFRMHHTDNPGTNDPFLQQ
jgi:hypothetical protein